MDWIHEKPRRTFRLKHKHAIMALALTAGVLSLAGIAAIAQSRNGATGKAQVIERRGPEIAINANGGGQVVVLFPQAANAQQQGGDVEIVLVESQQPAAMEGQPAPTAAPTGREILFSTRDANDGLVRHTLENSGNARKLMVLARVGGKYVEARQTGGSEGVNVFTVQQPMPETAAGQTDPAAAQTGTPPAATADAQAAGQPAAAGTDPVNPQAAAPAATPPTATNTSPATPAPPAQAAIVIVYTGVAR